MSLRSRRAPALPAGVLKGFSISIASARSGVAAHVPPGSGAVVMGTGIVSTALLLDGSEWPSRTLLALAAAAWITLAIVFGERFAHERARMRHEARAPAALSGVAATAVLGAGLVALGWSWAGFVLLGIAVILWLGLLPSVLRHWVTPTLGDSFLLTVSTEALAVLGASLAAGERSEVLLGVSLAPFLLGLLLYLFVLVRFDLRELAVGRGDQWVIGGALAISTLAGAQITQAAKGLGALGGLTGALTAVSVVLWGLGAVWLAVLVGAELAFPRFGYDLRRWSTVFPLGMYAASSFAVGSLAHAGAITDFAHGWVWVALAAWIAASAGLVVRAVRVLSAQAG